VPGAPGVADADAAATAAASDAAAASVAAVRAASQDFSTRTCRGGTARRTMSLALPAARSATLRARCQTSGVSTAASETSSWIGLNAPWNGTAVALSTVAGSNTSTTYPLRMRPPERNGTFTRTPARTPETSSSGMR